MVILCHVSRTARHSSGGDAARTSFTRRCTLALADRKARRGKTGRGRAAPALSPAAGAADPPAALGSAVRRRPCVGTGSDLEQATTQC